MRPLVLSIVRAYQVLVSPFTPANTCRFYPTCSQYMMDAVTKYGVVKGIWRGVKRIGRCHPFHPGGYDPA